MSSKFFDINFLLGCYPFLYFTGVEFCFPRRDLFIICAIKCSVTGKNKADVFGTSEDFQGGCHNSNKAALLCLCELCPMDINIEILICDLYIAKIHLPVLRLHEFFEY